MVLNTNSRVDGFAPAGQTLSVLEIPIPETLLDVLAGRLAGLLAGSPAAARWLTVRTAAEHLGLSEHAIRALVKRGRIPCHRIEGRVLFGRAELDSWVRSGGGA